MWVLLHVSNQETQYGIKMNPKEYADLIRKHWSVDDPFLANLMAFLDDLAEKEIKVPTWFSSCVQQELKRMFE